MRDVRLRTWNPAGDDLALVGRMGLRFIQETPTGRLMGGEPTLLRVQAAILELEAAAMGTVILAFDTAGVAVGFAALLRVTNPFTGGVWVDETGIWVEPVILKNRFYLANVDLTPPALAAPAAKVRAEAIDALVASFATAPSPCIIAGVIPGATKMPAGLSHDLLIGDPPIARFFLSNGWKPPTLLDGREGEITWGALVFKP